MTDKDHSKDNDNAGLPPPNRIARSGDVNPYDLAPEPTPAPRATIPPAEPKPGKLSETGLTDDFDEDTDFDKDPEVEKALKGDTGTTGESLAEDDETKPDPKVILVKPAGHPQVLAMIGGGVAIGAAVVAGYRSEIHWFYAGLLGFYMVALNTITGVAAIGVVAYFERARLGKLEHAAARMLIAVAAGSLILSIGTGGMNVITAPLGIAVYIGLVAALFRWIPPRLIRVVAVHGAMIAAFYFAMMLYAAAAGK